MFASDATDCLTMIYYHSFPLDATITEVIAALQVSVDWRTLSELMTTRETTHRTLLVDYDHYLHTQTTYTNHPLVSNHYDIVVYNAPQSIPTTQLLCFGRLRGLFYQPTSQQEILAGLRAIMHGDMAIPSPICHQLLQYYQATYPFSAKTGTSLSQRETQVLHALSYGHNNTQIADRFCISEFTVKSHLYNIYRKLAVKNRTQAMEWAKHHFINPEHG